MENGRYNDEQQVNDVAFRNTMMTLLVGLTSLIAGTSVGCLLGYWICLIQHNLR